MNSEQQEISKFNNLAINWWDENGPLKTLHQINPLRLNFILTCLKTHNLNNLNILDIGCGGGILSESLNNLGAKVVGIDLAYDTITTAKLHAAVSNLAIDYQISSAEDYASSSTLKFDVITCMELIEHVPNPESIIASMKKLLNPGGTIFLSTLNRNVKSYLKAIIGVEYILNWLPKGTHDYHKFIKPSELASLLRKNQLNLNKIAGINYSFLKKNFIMSDNIDVSYMICAS